MGFMGFGKKKEEDLDIPPPPPLDLGKQSNMLPPEMPVKEWEIPPISKPRMPDLPVIPDFDDLLNQKQPKPVMPLPRPMMPPPMASRPRIEPQMEKSALMSGRPVFIEINKYRQALRELNNVRNSLRQSDNEISELMGDISDEEKAFTKLHEKLSEVERKLVDLEGSLFTQ